MNIKIFDIPAIYSEKTIEPTNTFLRGNRVFGVDTKVLFLMVLLLLPSLASAKYAPTTRSRLMQKADKEYQLGNYDAARKIYSDIYVEDGDKASKELMSKCTQCLTLVSDALMAERNGQYSEAIEKYQAVMKLNPRDHKASMSLMECNTRLYAPLLQQAKDFYREGRYEDAKSELSEYTTQSGQTIHELSNSIDSCIVLNKKATQAIQLKEYKQAIQYYNDILEINPTDVVTTKAIAQIEAQNKRKVTATCEATLEVKTIVSRNSYCR